MFLQETQASYGLWMDCNNLNDKTYDCPYPILHLETISSNKNPLKPLNERFWSDPYILQSISFWTYDVKIYLRMALILMGVTVENFEKRSW